MTSQTLDDFEQERADARIRASLDGVITIDADGLVVEWNPAAERLLELGGEDVEFLLPVTQEELAGMVGASRERVNKAIASFIRLGWLEQHDRTYRITQRERLELRSR